MPKPDVISIRVDTDIKKMLDILCEQNDMTKTDFVETMIERLFKDHKMTEIKRARILNLVENLLDRPLAD